MRLLPLQSTAMLDRVAHRAACTVATVGLTAVAWLVAGLATVVTAADAPPVFRWAGDPEGGAPFVEADPSHPDALVGFDVEIADLMARGLGRPSRFINILFTSIDQSIA